MNCINCNHYIRIKDIEDTAVFKSHGKDFVSDIECPWCREVMTAKLETVLVPYGQVRREQDNH